MTYFLPDWNRSGYQRGGPPGGGDPGMKGTGQSYGSSYGPGRDPRPGGGDPGMTYTRPDPSPMLKRDQRGSRPFNPTPFERENFTMKRRRSPLGLMGLGALPMQQSPNIFSLDEQQQQIQLLALELMSTEGLSSFEAMDKAEETIKKKVFVEKGGSEYAEYIPNPKYEEFSMRTRQELPTGPHSDWRKFQVRDYVENDPLQRVQTDYMHSPIIRGTKPSKYSDMEAAEGGLAGTPFSRGGILGAF